MAPSAVGSRRGSLRVLQVVPRYYPHMGGVETHVYQVTQRLIQKDVDVTILTTDPTGTLPAEDVICDVRVHRVRSWPARSDYYFAPDLSAFIKSAPWDIVHVQSYHTLVPPLAMLAALGAHVPYVLTFHGGGHSAWIRNKVRRLQRRLLRPLLIRARRLIAVAAFEIDQYGRELGIPAVKFALIPNGADMPEAVHLNAPTPGAPQLIASIGRLERYKGHHRIIEALPAILRVRPHTRLWIAGNGPYEAELKRLAQKLGVAEYVEIRGIPPGDRARMAEELSRTSLVVLLSDFETHPIAAMEALALGRPVLVADTSGMRELAQRGLARSVPLRSTPEQIAAAVLEQLDNPLTPSQVTLPSWDDCATDLRNLYQAVVQEQASAAAF
jgi:glycosyltransferase involved in cell wall biosynthesis